MGADRQSESQYGDRSDAYTTGEGRRLLLTII